MISIRFFFAISFFIVGWIFPLDAPFAQQPAMSVEAGQRDDYQGVMASHDRSQPHAMAAHTGPYGLTPAGLRCEYLDRPMGIDMPDPRFYWKILSSAGGVVQAAYELMVASDSTLLERGIADMFHTGRVESSASTHIVYGGAPLQPAHTYYWRVRVWDGRGEVSAWSETSSFSTGLFSANDWGGARWIAWRPQEEWETEWRRKKEIESLCTEFALPSHFGARMNMWERYHFHGRPHDPAPLLRRAFHAEKRISSATAFVSGLGYYEFFINGYRVGDQVLDPGWTNYKKTILYAVHDVTRYLSEGPNAIGIMLGRGNYGMIAYDHWGFYQEGGYIGQPKLLFHLRVRYEDGSEEFLVSDGSWKITGGPVIYDCPHMGEIYDARKELPGWDMPGYDDSSWDGVNIAPHPGGELKAQLCEPIRITASRRPVEVQRSDFGKWWGDAGTMLSGWIRLRIRNANAGDRIIIYYGERDDPMDPGQPGGLQQMAYIAKGEDVEYAECRFSYKGFRYFNILGYPGELTIDDIEVYDVHSDIRPAGYFSSSDPIINAVHDICYKAIKYNMHSIPTDCPHREKNGWLGDAVTGIEAGMANFDLAALMTKFIRDIFDTQDEQGRLALIAPDTDYGKGASTLWSSAAVHLPWYMYTYYGDTRLFEQYWDRMIHWIESAWVYNNLPEKNGMFADVLSDWVTPLSEYFAHHPGGHEAIASMNFFLVLKRMAHMAEVIGKDDHTDALRQQKEQIRDAIHTWCFDAERFEYHGLEPSPVYIPVLNLMALDYGIVPARYHQQVEDRLIRNIAEEREQHLWGGIFAVLSAYDYLPEHGHAELAYRTVVQPTYPSFGYMVGNGATTLWESFHGNDSRMHYFLGAVDNFFYRHLAGIQFDQALPGFRHILFRPRFIPQLDQVQAIYQSIHGEISAKWLRHPGGIIEYEVKVPPNTNAVFSYDQMRQEIGSGTHRFMIEVPAIE